MKKSTITIALLATGLALCAAARRGAAKIGATQPVGDFGPIYAGYRHKGKEAIKKLMKTRQGECPGALHRPDIGDIDLVWARATNAATHEGFGLAHALRQGLRGNAGGVRPTDRLRQRKPAD